MYGCAKQSFKLRKATNRQNAKRWRGPKRNLDIDEADATAKFQYRISTVALNCARKAVQGKDVEGKDVEGKELNPLQAGTRLMGMAPWEISTLRNGRHEMEVGEEKVNTISSREARGDGPHTSPEATPVAGTPSLSVRAPSSPKSSTRHPAPEYSLDRNCKKSQGPEADRTQYEKLA